MAVNNPTCMVLVACVFSCAISAMAVSLRPSSIAQAEQRLKELGKILFNIKNSVRPRHCTDILLAGQRSSGLYTIFPLESEPSGQIVYCDMNTDGGGWTVIQRRGQFGNNAYYFYRNWAEYATGFGDPDKEYWIGNRALHALASDTAGTTLRIELMNETRSGVSFHYKSFHVDSEEELFRLSLGKYIGPAGWDSMRHSHEAAFSTHDRDNDRRSSGSCAIVCRGAWWYNDCSEANLNGLNLNGYHDSAGDGIEWTLRGVEGSFHHYSYPRAVMMIRTDL